MSGSNPSRKPWVKPPRLVDEAEVAMARRSPRRRKGFSLPPATCQWATCPNPSRGMISHPRRMFSTPSDAPLLHALTLTVTSHAQTQKLRREPSRITLE